jgi:GH24 family phage-related lysozyme (muramidase)
MTRSFFCSTLLSLALSASASAQTSLPAPNPAPAQDINPAAVLEPAPSVSPAVQLLRDFKAADVKFDLGDMMEILRDRKHEGWVLSAYPDPKTSDPLIGAGFTLNLPAREHPQHDALNPHPFLEPSSAELWQAAGLESDRLQQILAQYRERMSTWNKKKFRKQIKTLPADITDDEASLLLRISAVQAIYNAKAYCRNFDQLSASQQMALSQLVYQMGVNLEEFSQFLSLINSDSVANVSSANAASPNTEYWKSVQLSLTQSQWARLYRTRAITVVAMLDPTYADSPSTAERRVSAVLRPAVLRRHRGHSAGVYQVASASPHHGHSAQRKSHAHSKRRV